MVDRRIKVPYDLKQRHSLANCTLKYTTSINSLSSIKNRIHIRYALICIVSLFLSFCFVYLIYILWLHEPTHISFYTYSFLHTSFRVITAMSKQYRNPGPASSPVSDDQEHESEHTPPPEKGTWKKRVSTACLACKKSKRKVSLYIPTMTCRSRTVNSDSDIFNLTINSAVVHPLAQTVNLSNESASSTNLSINAVVSLQSARQTNSPTTATF